MAKLEYVEGIGSRYAQQLRDAGVTSTKKLLDRGATPQGRKNLARDTGISPDLILEWVNHADLFRIKGVGEEYADLLEEVGVDTVVELAQRNPENLFAALRETNGRKNLVRRPPGKKAVHDWVKMAQKLPRKVHY